MKKHAFIPLCDVRYSFLGPHNLSRNPFTSCPQRSDLKPLFYPSGAPLLQPSARLASVLAHVLYRLLGGGASCPSPPS